MLIIEMGLQLWRKMALIGYQLLSTIIVATFLVKLSPILSPVDLLCSRLKFYFAPQGTDSSTKKGKKNEFKLQECLLHSTELQAIKYYEQCRELVHYTCASIVVFASNCLYWVLYTSYASKEFNFSLCWVGIGLLQWTRLAVLITKLYFSRSSVHSEGLMCLASTAGGVLLAVFLLAAGENFSGAPLSLTIRSLERAGVSGAVAGGVVYAGLVGVCAAITAALTFPAFRLAQENRRLLSATKTATTTTLKSLALKCLCYLHFYLPHATALCLFKPGLHYVAYDLFDLAVSERDLPWLGCLLVALYGALSALMARRLLQSYLRRGPGLVQQYGSNITSSSSSSSKADGGREELSNLVAYVPKYFGVVLAQLTLPVVLLLSLAMLGAVSRPHLCCLAYARAEASDEEGLLLSPLFRFLLMFSVSVLGVLSSLGSLYYSTAG